ncbi:hypothetical protein OROHE_022553 [Orobanche hederae]
MLSLFKKAMKRFNVAWWAYSYTITILALASVRYEQEVRGGVPRVISLSLSALSILVHFGLLFFTASNPKLFLPHDDPNSSHKVCLPIPTTHSRYNSTVQVIK